jgi:hypothetical protein
MISSLRFEFLSVKLLFILRMGYRIILYHIKRLTDLIIISLLIGIFEFFSINVFKYQQLCFLHSIYYLICFYSMMTIDKFYNYLSILILVYYIIFIDERCTSCRLQAIVIRKKIIRKICVLFT